jgi:hypothetical protein
VKVRRDGKTIQILNTDVQVGDIVELESGDEIPADGIYIEGNRTDIYISLFLFLSGLIVLAVYLVVLVGSMLRHERVLRGRIASDGRDRSGEEARAASLRVRRHSGPLCTVCVCV